MANAHQTDVSRCASSKVTGKDGRMRVRTSGLVLLAATLALLSPIDAFAGYGVENLARGKAVTPLTSTVSGSPASVVDGNIGTSWFSSSSYQAFVLDLGQVYDIGKINMLLTQVSSYTVSTSLDNATWTARHGDSWYPVVAPVALAPDGAYAARYIKLESANLGYGMWIGTNEFEVYSWQATPPPSPPGALGMVNIAQGRPLTAVTGGGDPANPPANVVDGNDTTAWISTAYSTWTIGFPIYHGYGSMVIDLGQSYSIGRIVVKPRGLHWYWLVMSETLTPGGTYPVDTAGPWLFASSPELFATRSTTSTPQTFDLQGRATGRYLYLLMFTSSVPGGPVYPGMDEIEVYEWTAAARDITPPEITPTVAGIVGNDGWYVSDVTITWTVTDPESEVTSSAGCEPSTLAADTGGTTRECTATSAGGTASASVTVKRDATPPSVTIAAPADGAIYPVGAAVTASWSASDATSGIATVAATSEDGAALDTGTPGAKSYTVTATDAAGNRRSVTQTYTVQTPAQMAQALAAQVAGLGLPAGTANALIAKLDAAAAAWSRGQVNAAANQVGAFINQVEALAGKKIGAADAAGLVAAAQALIAAILGG